MGVYESWVSFLPQSLWARALSSRWCLLQTVNSCSWRELSQVSTWGHHRLCPWDVGNGLCLLKSAQAGRHLGGIWLEFAVPNLATDWVLSVITGWRQLQGSAVIIRRPGHLALRLSLWSFLISPAQQGISTSLSLPFLVLVPGHFWWEKQKSKVV